MAVSEDGHGARPGHLPAVNGRRPDPMRICVNVELVLRGGQLAVRARALLEQPRRHGRFRTVATLDIVQSLDPAFGGADTISGGDAEDLRSAAATIGSRPNAGRPHMATWTRVRAFRSASR